MKEVYRCKYCSVVFKKTEDLINHKKEWHLQEIRERKKRLQNENTSLSKSEPSARIEQEELDNLHSFNSPSWNSEHETTLQMDSRENAADKYSRCIHCFRKFIFSRKRVEHQETHKLYMKSES